MSTIPLRAIGGILLLLISFTPTAWGQTTLPIPAEVSGTLRQDASLQYGDRGSFNVYAFYAVSGVRYTVTVSSSSFLPHVSVLRVSGPLTELVRDQGSESSQAQLTFRVNQTGRHYVVVQSVNSVTYDGEPQPPAGGAYTLSLRERPVTPPPPPRPIALGTRVESRLGPESALMFNNWEAEVPYEAYSILLEAGKRVRIAMESSDFDAYLEIGADEGILAQDDDGGTGTNSLLRFTPQTSGMYFIRARSFGPDASGSYTLHVELQETTPPPPAIPIAIGMSRTGTLSANSPLMESSWGADVAYDLYALEVTPGQSFSIHMMSEEFDSFVEFGQFTPDGFEIISSDDDGGDGSNALLRILNNDGGSFFIRARTYAAEQYGAYTLRIEPFVPRDPVRAPISVGQTLSGTISLEDALSPEGIHFQEFTFQAMAGRTYTIRMASEVLDAFLSLGWYENGVYRELDSNDDFPGDGLNAGIVFTAQESREMTIRARPLRMGATGAFTLSLTANTR